jgi:hypothetical protein
LPDIQLTAGKSGLERVIAERLPTDPADPQQPPEELPPIRVLAEGVDCAVDCLLILTVPAGL